LWWAQAITMGLRAVGREVKSTPRSRVATAGGDERRSSESDSTLGLLKGLLKGLLLGIMGVSLRLSDQLQGATPYLSLGALQWSRKTGPTVQLGQNRASPTPIDQERPMMAAVAMSSSNSAIETSPDTE